MMPIMPSVQCYEHIWQHCLDHILACIIKQPVLPKMCSDSIYGLAKLRIQQIPYLKLKLSKTSGSESTSCSNWGSYYFIHHCQPFESSWRNIHISEYLPSLLHPLSRLKFGKFLAQTCTFLVLIPLVLASYNSYFCFLHLTYNEHVLTAI